MPDMTPAIPAVDSGASAVKAVVEAAVSETVADLCRRHPIYAEASLFGTPATTLPNREATPKSKDGGLR